MRKAETIALRLYGEGADAGRIEEVSRVLDALALARAAETRRSRLPVREIPLGGTLRVSGHLLRCVERPADVWPPSEACSGCAVARLYLGCGDLKCSVFDRSDGRNVWFEEEAE